MYCIECILRVHYTDVYYSMRANYRQLVINAPWQVLMLLCCCVDTVSNCPLLQVHTVTYHTQHLKQSSLTLSKWPMSAVLAMHVYGRVSHTTIYIIQMICFHRTCSSLKCSAYQTTAADTASPYVLLPCKCYTTMYSMVCTEGTYSVCPTLCCLVSHVHKHSRSRLVLKCIEFTLLVL
jgi:hypothetical protein